MQVGDKVNYIPHECHIFERNLAGDYPFVFGRKRMVNVDGGFREEITELHSRALEEYMDEMRRMPPEIQVQMRKNMVILRPNFHLEATVHKVNDDGTVALSIKGIRSGVTHHCDNVKVDETKKTLHTCHSIDGGE